MRKPKPDGVSTVFSRRARLQPWPSLQGWRILYERLAGQGEKHIADSRGLKNGVMRTLSVGLR